MSRISKSQRMAPERHICQTCTNRTDTGWCGVQAKHVPRKGWCESWCKKEVDT